MKLNSVLLILLLILIGCKRTTKSKDQSLTITEEVGLESKNEIIIQNFDYREFLKRINNTLSKDFNVNEAPIKESNLINNNALKYLISEDINIDLYLYKNNNFKLELFVINTDDTIKLDNLFSKLNELGYSKDRSKDLVPGLSYANDFVVTDDKSIFWFNSPCTISYDNHIALSKHLMEIINSTNNKASNNFYCKCGKPTCN